MLWAVPAPTCVGLVSLLDSTSLKSRTPVAKDILVRHQLLWFHCFELSNLLPHQRAFLCTLTWLLAPKASAVRILLLEPSFIHIFQTSVIIISFALLSPVAASFRLAFWLIRALLPYVLLSWQLLSARLFLLHLLFSFLELPFQSFLLLLNIYRNLSSGILFGCGIRSSFGTGVPAALELAASSRFFFIFIIISVKTFLLRVTSSSG